MIDMPVREHDQPHPPAGRGDQGLDGGEMGGVQRPRVDTTARGAPGSARTQVFVPSRVIGPGFGARTQVARSLTGPPAQLTARTPSRPAAAA